MLRRIIKINEEKCNGCGLCATACHEGAIGIQEGKAVLLREDYCDGLGDCLPACPMDAISFEEREAPAYDEAAVKIHLKNRDQNQKSSLLEIESELRQWPVQIKLAPITAPFYQEADLLIAADCTAYAYGNFHQKFIRGRIVLVGCPKLDNMDYSEKLTEIITRNNIRTIMVTRMTVPCCGGIEAAVKKAIENSGKKMECQVVTISPRGEIM